MHKRDPVQTIKQAFKQILEYNNKIYLRSITEDWRFYIGEQWASILSFMKKT